MIVWNEYIDINGTVQVSDKDIKDNNQYKYLITIVVLVLCGIVVGYWLWSNYCIEKRKKRKK